MRIFSVLSAGSFLRRLPVLLILGSTVQACTINPTIVAEGPHQRDAQGAPGLRYHLAKDLIQVSTTKVETRTHRPKADLSGPEVESKIEVQTTASLATVADVDTFYVVDATPGRWNDNLLTVQTTGEGLLQSINAESTGQVGEFVKSLGQIIGVVAGAALLDAGAGAPWPPESPCRPMASLSPDFARRLFEYDGAGVVTRPRSASLPKARTARLYVLRDTVGCELWQKLELVAYEADLQRVQRGLLSAQIRAATAKEIPDLKSRLAATDLALAALAGDREAWLAAFRHGLEEFEKQYQFGTKTITVADTFDFDVSELPPDAIMNGANLLEDRLRTNSWTKALELYELSRSIVTLRHAGQMTPPTNLAAPGAVSSVSSCTDATQGQGANSSGAKAVRLYYRGTEPVIVTVYGPDDQGTIVPKKRELMQIINRGRVHCVAFAESGLSVRKLKLGMDTRGRITLLDRSSTSDAKAAAAAVAGALTSARDAYADTLTSVVGIQENQRKIALNDLELEVSKLKKEKEAVDADIALQGTLASHESTLEQQRLTAELALLQARLNLETAQSTYAGGLEVAQLKTEVERLKQELELLKAQLALAAAGGD